MCICRKYVGRQLTQKLWSQLNWVGKKFLDVSIVSKLKTHRHQRTYWILSGVGTNLLSGDHAGLTHAPALKIDLHVFLLALVHWESFLNQSLYVYISNLIIVICSGAFGCVNVINKNYRLWQDNSQFLWLLCKCKVVKGYQHSQGYRKFLFPEFFSLRFSQW